LWPSLFFLSKKKKLIDRPTFPLFPFLPVLACPAFSFPFPLLRLDQRDGKRIVVVAILVASPPCIPSAEIGDEKAFLFFFFSLKATSG